MDVTMVLSLLIFLFGASIGSFLNVVIYRVPHRLSVSKPRSYCPGCKKSIPAWENIPVLSWCLLRGRCSTCAMGISPRYVLIELAMGLLTLALFFDFAGGPPEPANLVVSDFFGAILGPFLAYTLFVAALVALAFIDLDYFIIPDNITLPGMVIGVGVTAAVGPAIGIETTDGLLGVVSGAGFIIALIVGYGALTGREGMGGGDWKLMGFIGAFLGWQALPFVLFAGAIQGLLFALLFRRSFAIDELPPDPMDVADGVAPHLPEKLAPPSDPDSDEETPFSQLAVPFGPFLALGALEFLLFRTGISAWMASLVNPV